MAKADHGGAAEARAEGASRGIFKGGREPLLDTRKATQRLRQAESLFKAGDPQGALTLLEGLEEACPGEQRIPYGRAMCLAQLGRRAEAMMLCDDLIARYQDAKAQVLKERIMALSDGPMIAAPVRDRTGSFPRSLGRGGHGGLGGAAVMAGLLLVALSLPWTGGAVLGMLINSELVPLNPGSVVAMMLLFALAVFGLGLYALWGASGRLPGDSVPENLKVVLIETLITALLLFIPVIGWVFAVFRLVRRYELPAGVAVASMVWCLAAFISVVISVLKALGAGGLAWIAGALLQ